jgi:hypothetical protein
MLMLRHTASWQAHQQDAPLLQLPQLQGSRARADTHQGGAQEALAWTEQQPALTAPTVPLLLLS